MPVNLAGMTMEQVFGMRRTMPSPKNPMDKSTIVSIFPKPLRERKETICPGLFELEAGSPEKPTVLVVGSSSWWKDVDPEQPLLEIPDGSVLVAKSIVDDYCKGMLGCDMKGSMPGLFWVPGAFSVFEIQKNHADKLREAKIKQDNWYKELIKLADIGWAKSNGNPITIALEMKLAATMLGLVDKPWMKDQIFLELSNCPACGNKTDPKYPMCANCKTIINPELFARLNLKQAINQAVVESK